MHQVNIAKSTDFAKSVLDEFQIRLEVEGLENIPGKGGCVLASNHPLGALDALALIHAVSSVRTDQKFIVNDVLLTSNKKSLLFK